MSGLAREFKKKIEIVLRLFWLLLFLVSVEEVKTGNIVSSLDFKVHTDLTKRLARALR